MRPLAIGLFAFAALAAAQEFKVGSKVDDFKVTDLKGATAHFASLKGDTTVIAFMAVNCPVSNAYNDRMQALFDDYSAKGVKFVFINANVNESAADVERHAQAHGFHFAIFKDADDMVADRFGAQVTPETFVVDRSGTIRYHGSIDDSQNSAHIKTQRLRLALDSVIAGRPVEQAETKAFGCSIKRRRAS